MYSGSTEFNNLIEKSGGNALITRFKFSNFTLTQFIKLDYYGGSNNSDDIAIGTTNMAYLDVSAITDKIITNQEFLFEVGMELSDGTIEYAPMGYFTVQKPDSDEDEVNFTACDRMQKFEKPYVSSLEYPTDSQKILYELCTMCEVQLATPILNPITITDKLDGYTCREVLGYIAGIHGLFACFDRYGKLNVRWYRSTPIEKQIGLIWSLTKSQSDFTVEKVTLAKDAETIYTSGSGGSCGISQSNPYATFDIAKSLYAKLGGYTYRPCEISMLDDIRLDAWDTLKVTYLDGSVLTIPVMSLEHSFTSGETRVKSFGKTDTESEYSYSGPTTQAMDRMATELLVVNRVVATKVDAEYVNAHAITTDNLSAIEAEIKSAVIQDISAEYADIRLANIDTANIDVAKIGSLFAEVGLIDSAIIKDGHITGYLDSVEVNADKITAGTIVADRIALVMRDEAGNEKGLIYALNNLGELTSENINTIDGNVITPHTIGADHIIARSITADRLVANSITANELNVKNIFANEAVLNEIFAQNITATGTITGATLKGAHVESDSGEIAGFTLSNEAYEEYPDVTVNTMSWGYSDPGLGTNTVVKIYGKNEFGEFIELKQTETDSDDMNKFSITNYGAINWEQRIGNDIRYASIHSSGVEFDCNNGGSFSFDTGKKYLNINNMEINISKGNNSIRLDNLIPTAQTITIPSNNANFSGGLYIATSGKVRTIYAELVTKKQITAAMNWLNVLKFAEKPIQTVESTFSVNSTASPVPVFLARAIPGGSLDIIARQNIASGSSLRFTLTVILA